MEFFSFEYTLGWDLAQVPPLNRRLDPPVLTASSCATLAAVRCRITPITLFTVGSCELEKKLGIDGNRTSGSMPPDFTLVLGGMTVFNPVCGRPARWRTRSSSRRQGWKTDRFLVPFRPGALFSVASYPRPGLSP